MQGSCSVLRRDLQAEGKYGEVFPSLPFRGDSSGNEVFNLERLRSELLCMPVLTTLSMTCVL